MFIRRLQNPKGESSVESQLCAQNAQRWGTRPSAGVRTLRIHGPCRPPRKAGPSLRSGGQSQGGAKTRLASRPTPPSLSEPAKQLTGEHAESEDKRSAESLESGGVCGSSSGECAGLRPPLKPGTCATEEILPASRYVSATTAISSTAAPASAPSASNWKVKPRASPSPHISSFLIFTGTTSRAFPSFGRSTKILRIASPSTPPAGPAACSA